MPTSEVLRQTTRADNTFTKHADGATPTNGNNVLGAPIPSSVSVVSGSVWMLHVASKLVASRGDITTHFVWIKGLAGIAVAVAVAVEAAVMGIFS
jgi:hypothetical protein